MAFATLSFAGDALDPNEISAILPEAKPWRAHRKGETFYAGQRSGHLSGRTGAWVFSTDKISESPDLTDHLRIIAHLLHPSPGNNLRLMKLRDVLGRLPDTKSHISVFWRGAPGEAAPTIPDGFAALAREIGARIEMDFDD